MATYSEIAANVRGGAFDTARRLVKVEEELLDALEEYQGALANDVRTPWAAVKTTYSFVKQVAGIQSDHVLDWTSTFARTGQQSTGEAATATGAA